MGSSASSVGPPRTCGRLGRTAAMPAAAWDGSRRRH
jgi:hypothetical protein